MEGKQLGFLGVGVFIFVVVMCFGIVMTATLSYTSRADTTIDVAGITVATNGSLTNFGASYPYVQDVAGCVNATGTATLASTNYTVVTGTSTGSGGFILLDSGSTFSGWVVNCTDVQYLKSTTASTAISALIVLFGTLAGLAVLAVLFMVIKPLLKIN